MCLILTRSVEKLNPTGDKALHRSLHTEFQKFYHQSQSSSFDKNSRALCLGLKRRINLHDGNILTKSFSETREYTSGDVYHG